MQAALLVVLIAVVVCLSARPLFYLFLEYQDARRWADIPEQPYRVPDGLHVIDHGARYEGVVRLLPRPLRAPPSGEDD